MVIERNLVDEVRLIRYPVLLGGGTPLFPANGTQRALLPIDTLTFDSGATVERYRFG
ncbi:MAG: dihydrofolate reductase family protein [Gemmatimonadales bacterium]